jgi:opacity protein-like surface antigen
VKTLAATAFALAGLLVDVSPARSEWFADLYGGEAFTRRHHFSLDGRQDGGHVAGLVEDASFEKSFEVGARVGYWLDSLRVVGFGLDVSHFRPDIKAQTAIAKGDITDRRGALLGVPLNVNGATRVRLSEIDFHVTLLAVDVMLRWPTFVSASFPNGRLQPYVLAGPAVAVADLERFETSVSLWRSTLHNARGPRRVRPSAMEMGGGLMWGFTQHLSIFAEYRYTHIRPSLDAAEVTFKTHLGTHHLLSGLSVRF